VRRIPFKRERKGYSTPRNFKIVCGSLLRRSEEVFPPPPTTLKQERS
jgi:hypothetical protein